MNDLNTYDPSADGETVDKVRAYLATATADEVGRVKALEEAGLKRKGVLEWAPDKPNLGPDAGDGYKRVEVEDPYPPGEPAAWGHRGLNETQDGTADPEG